jgi:hypothetical protein
MIGHVMPCLRQLHPQVGIFSAFSPWMVTVLHPDKMFTKTNSTEARKTMKNTHKKKVGIIEDYRST